MSEKANKIVIKIRLMEERIKLLEAYVEAYKAQLEEYEVIRDEIVELSTYKEALQAIKNLNIENKDLEEILNNLPK